MSEEQKRAFAHATGAEGLALIDGQAGTGKSYTIAAVREAYEKAGYGVIGLAPTNPVADDMAHDGFTRALTAHKELFALNNGRRSWNAKTAVIVDEAAMLDTKIMAMLTSHAAYAGVKLILVGDDRQLSSIDRGGMFGALKDRHGAAELTEVKRQHKNDERRASAMMAEGNFHDALKIYEQKGSINWTRTQPGARAALIAQWAKDSAVAPEKSRFVFAYTNEDVSRLNAGLRAVRKDRGELGADVEFNTAHGRVPFAAGDRIQFTETNKQTGINNNDAGTIEAISGNELTVRLDKGKNRSITFNAELFDKFRHGYAGTIYRGQGKTLDQTYLYHSEHWRSAPSYVALTRHRDKTELYVARNTAKDIKQLARQMARTDERRAASMFKHKEITSQRLFSPDELLAELAPEAAVRKKEGRNVADGQSSNPTNAPVAATTVQGDTQVLKPGIVPEDAARLAPDIREQARSVARSILARVSETLGGWVFGWHAGTSKAEQQLNLKHGAAQENERPPAPLQETDVRLAQTLARVNEELQHGLHQEPEPQLERDRKRGRHF
jgi:ATP-dependent exoDNAse (exonuclease V) alpha subunit